MNRSNTELENKVSEGSGETDPPVDTVNSKASASSMAKSDPEESNGNTLDKDEAVNGQVLNDTSSSELSTRSEARTGANGETLQTTDSDCRGSLVGKGWEKTTRQKSRKRKSKPLIPGYARDWESNDSWTSEKAQEDCTVVAEEIETKRRKIKSLQQKNRRLKFRHSRLKAAIKEMKANMADRD